MINIPQVSFIEPLSFLSSVDSKDLRGIIIYTFWRTTGWVLVLTKPLFIIICVWTSKSDEWCIQCKLVLGWYWCGFVVLVTADDLQCNQCRFSVYTPCHTWVGSLVLIIAYRYYGYLLANCAQQALIISTTTLYYLILWTLGICQYWRAFHKSFDISNK